MHVGVVVVERQRPVQLRNDLGPDRILVFAPAVDQACPRMQARQDGMRIVGIERDSPVDEGPGLLVIRNRAPVMQHLGGKGTFVGRPYWPAVVRRAGPAARPRRAPGALPLSPRHLVLDGEDVVQLRRICRPRYERR